MTKMAITLYLGRGGSTALAGEITHDDARQAALAGTPHAWMP